MLLMLILIKKLKDDHFHNQTNIPPCLFLIRLKAVLNWAEHSVREQLCLLEMFKLAVRFLIDVFDLGKQLCSRPMGRRSDVRNVGSTGYGSMLLIG